MKIGVLTFHNADNCGAVLQAYAFTDALNALPNCNAEIINYHNLRLENSYKPFNLLKSKNPIKFIGKIFLRSYFIFKRYNGFADFRRKHLKTSEKDYYFSNRSEILNDYDVIITGSDQVFNLNISGQDDTTYFLDISVKGALCKKYTYAASIGDLPTEKDELKRFIDLLKNNFSYISFREKSSVDFLAENCSEIPCTSHLDPVFLLNGEAWRKISADKKITRYVLYFNICKSESTSKAMRSAVDFAKANSLEPYYSSTTIFSREKGMRYLSCESPDVLLGSIKNADYVFTDSFHGAALCILMHKNFFVETNIIRNSRVLDLLELTGLSHRGMKDGVISCDYVISEEEWAYADAQIEKERQRAKDYLISIVKNKEDIDE